jgi:hypothetical protein
MKRIYVTLLERVDSPGDSPADIGEVIVLDWETKKVVERIAVDSEKTVQVGRSRGATGITWYNNRIFVSCRSGIVVIDPETKETLALTGLPLPGGLHQIKSYKDSLYMSCTEGDYLVVMRSGELPRPTKLPTGYEAVLHFNSIAWDSKGDQYHLYMGDVGTHRSARKSPSRIVNYTTGKEIHGNLGRLPHDICFIDDTKLLFTASADGELKLLDLKARRCTVVFKRGIKGDPKGSYRLQGFMRGVTFDEKTGSVFVGTAPGTLYDLDVHTWEVKASIDFNVGVGTAVYDILLDPRDWDLLDAPEYAGQKTEFLSEIMPELPPEPEPEPEILPEEEPEPEPEIYLPVPEFLPMPEPVPQILFTPRPELPPVAVFKGRKQSRLSPLWWWKRLLGEAEMCDVAKCNRPSVLVYAAFGPERNKEVDICDYHWEKDCDDDDKFDIKKYFYPPKKEKAK